MLDSLRRANHDLYVESPSFFEAVIRFPGAVVRFPSVAVDTLEAINDLVERIDRLMAMLEPLQGGIDLAGAGMSVATTGIAQAVAGLHQAVERLDRTVPPPFSAATSQLRNLSERLNGSALDVMSTTTGAALQDEASELHGEGTREENGEAAPEQPLIELELSMVELARSLDSLVGAIPVLRQVIRVTSSPQQGPEEEDEAAH